jgi:hypothetical protein
MVGHSTINLSKVKGFLNFSKIFVQKCTKNCLVSPMLIDISCFTQRSH